MAIPNEMNDDALKKRLGVIDDLIKDGTIFEAPDGQLKDGLHALCEQRADSIFTAREINKGILINTILAERRARCQNLLIIGLAIIAICVGIAQVWYASHPVIPKVQRNVEQHTDDEHPNLDQGGDDNKEISEVVSPVLPIPTIPKSPPSTKQ